MFMKCNFRNRGEIEVSQTDAYAMIPKDRCFVFVHTNKSNWLKNMSTAVSVATPEEFLTEPHILVDDEVMIRPIPPIPVD